LPAIRLRSVADLSGAVLSPAIHLGCWVSKNCYEPKNLLSHHILPALSRGSANLTVLLNTVVKRVQTESAGGHRTIRSITAIRREPRSGVAWGGYDRRLSEDALMGG